MGTIQFTSALVNCVVRKSLPGHNISETCCRRRSIASIHASLVFARCLIFSRNSQKIPHKNAAQIHNATLIHLTNCSFVVYFQNDSVLLIATKCVLHIYHSDAKFTKKICAVFLTLFQFVQPCQGVMRAAAILNCHIAFEVKIFGL